jgi:hypothetical protein
MQRCLPPFPCRDRRVLIRPRSLGLHFRFDLQAEAIDDPRQSIKPERGMPRSASYVGPLTIRL